MTKLHNNPRAVAMKVELRRRVLAGIGANDARVLDVFCGPVGEMHAAVWADAGAYAGIDEEWIPATDARVRYVGDSRIVLRAIALDVFNVFDVDAFGSPWWALEIIAARRRWQDGERGAVVVTDGGGMKSRYGAMPSDLRRVLGTTTTTTTTTTSETHAALHAVALKRWLSTQGLRIDSAWSFSTNSSGKGAQKMIYSAALFTKSS